MIVYKSASDTIHSTELTAPLNDANQGGLFLCAKKYPHPIDEETTWVRALPELYYSHDDISLEIT
ncbi:hypothetical protein GCM10025859_01970 [Alicyclobacillus fastidiosus]|nr:hypothetical protein GCM10025859_01970 [Alicyclobacillus fastidiosus]